MRRHALIVDDNRSLAEDLGEILEDEGYDVTVFDSPHKALAASRTLQFDVALLDMRMPGMDGVVLHEGLAAEHPHARFVLMTAYTADERIAEALRGGVRAVLPKPLSLAALLSALEQRAIEHVLLIDDDRAFSEALSEVLTSSGYRCSVGHTAADARSMAKLLEPDVIIVDVRLPDGDGAELSIELARESAAPVILITGFDPERARRGLGAGLVSGRLLVKPFSPEQVLRALAELRGHAA